MQQGPDALPPANMDPSCLVFKDKNTLTPYVEDLSKYGDDGTSQQAAKPDHIYMDCMAFGKSVNHFVFLFSFAIPFDIEYFRGFYLLPCLWIFLLNYRHTFTFP